MYFVSTLYPFKYLLILSTLILFVFSFQGISQTSWPERRAFAPQGLRSDRVGPSTCAPGWELDLVVSAV
jgi:hypothetical protein